MSFLWIPGTLNFGFSYWWILVFEAIFYKQLRYLYQFNFFHDSIHVGSMFSSVQSAPSWAFACSRSVRDFPEDMLLPCELCAPLSFMIIVEVGSLELVMRFCSAWRSWYFWEVFLPLSELLAPPVYSLLFCSSWYLTTGIELRAPSLISCLALGCNFLSSWFIICSGWWFIIHITQVCIFCWPYD